MTFLSIVLSAILLVGQPSLPHLESFVTHFLAPPPTMSSVSVDVIANSAPAIVRIESDFKIVEGQLLNSTGTGFFVDPSHVLTNAHVVGSQKNVMLTIYPTGEEPQFIVGTVVSRDPVGDLALIEVPERPHQPTLPLAKKAPPPGTGVVVIGFPYSQWRASKGTITGETTASSLFSSHRGSLTQTDAPIGPGNSGGPVISLQTKEVVGMASSHIVESDGMGFAIPATSLQEFYHRALQGKPQEYRYLGIRIAQLNPLSNSVLCQTLPIPCSGESGVVTTWVQDTSPAAFGGLQAGDILLSLNGSPLHFEKDLFALLVGPVGAMDLEVKRAGHRLHLTINAQALSEDVLGGVL